MRAVFGPLAALLVAGAALVPAAPAAAKGEKGWVQLFNSKDLSGWDTWLGRPFKGKEVVGLNRDPAGVYKVVEADGRPAIRISGEIFGALTSQKEYGNYHLRLQFKWGKERWPPRAKDIRDSGLLYHCVGPHGAGGTFWMRSLEFQIEETDCGDFWSVDGATVDVQGEQKTRGGEIYYKKGGKTFTVPTKATGARIIKDHDYERPSGQWNTLDLYAVGGTSVHVVNGHPVMVLTNARQKVGGKMVPLHRGKLQLQSEGAEVYYRDIAIRPIERIPEELLK
jgi:hypothetical protein